MNNYFSAANKLKVRARELGMLDQVNEIIEIEKELNIVHKMVASRSVIEGKIDKARNTMLRINAQIEERRAQ